MSKLQLTKTKMKQGLWQGIVTGAGDDKPQIAVTHQDQPVDGFELQHDERGGYWLLTLPIPAEMIADGVHTLLIRDASRNEKLGHVTLVAGDALEEDILAEMSLLRAELDMLKSAFRRHCVETS